MRIVIDLSDGLNPNTLREVRQFAHWAQSAQTQPEIPSAPTIWVALCNSNRADDSTGQAAFSKLVQATRHILSDLPVQVVVYDLPTSTRTTDWMMRAREAIRENFLAGLRPDVVYVPELFSNPQAVFSIGKQSAHFHTVVRPVVQPVVQQVNAAQASDRETEFRREAWLSRARLCLSPDADAIACIRALPAYEFAPENPPIKPRLAYISPLPPEKSGIADYSTELIPHLAHYYEIELVLDQTALNAPWISARFPIRSLDWFRANAGQYQRILYHFGNSQMHQHMFELFEQHPGIIVLHDFYLGNILGHLHQTNYLPGIYPRALYQSHGWTAMLDHQQIGIVESSWKYPCNLALLEQAEGVIVHSEYPRRLAQQWYGPQAADDWRKIAHLRNPLPTKPNRDAARAELFPPDLPPDAFIVCSFGMLGSTKANQHLLDAWLSSALANDPRCHLIFVGENDAGAYGKELSRRIQGQTDSHNNRDISNVGNVGNVSHIQITGFVSTQTYRTWLQAADCAVQLRTKSRGETSGAVLDSLLHGLPTIVNAHGTSAELPDTTVLKLPEVYSIPVLKSALEQLWQDSALRQRLSLAAQTYIQADHAPATVARQYHAAIEHFTHTGRQQPYRQLLQTLQHISPFKGLDSAAASSPSQIDYLACAAAIAANQPARPPRQCLIDISAMVQTDLRTGIQRVVRSIVIELIRNPPAGFRVEPVYTRGGEPYHYARRYMTQQLGSPDIGLPDTPIETHDGDVFIGIDLFMHGTFLNRQWLASMRNHGVQLIFVVYDILPLLRPEVFPTGSEADFERWLRTVAELSDGLLCISNAVMHELHTWLQAHPIPRERPLALGYFHLGADIAASVPSTGLPENAQQILDALRTRPSILMVGTVEPRKAQTQALAAFELLWSQGMTLNLVIIGKQGWMMDSLANRLRQHPENGQRLFWLPGVSDEMLLATYQAGSALLAASEGEGFGLPLIEAAQHQLPIIARGLPVFKEVSGEHAFYFDGLKADDLAQAMRVWLDLYHAGQAPASKDMPWLTWEQSAQQLKAVIWGREWVMSYDG